MKMFAALLVSVLSLSASAQSKGSEIFPEIEKKPRPTMSAFATDKTIYVTVLGDGCNAVGGHLKVDGICNDDRLTRNYAQSCSAQLDLMMTEMMCPGNRPPKATVLEFDIKKS